MRVKKTLNSGSVLELDYCSFRDALNLLQKIAKIINRDDNFKLDNNFISSLTSENNGNMDNMINVILKPILDGIADNDLIDLVIKSGNQSLINGERITLDYFEDVEHCKDFFVVMFEVAKYNLERFLSKVPTKS